MATEPIYIGADHDVTYNDAAVLGVPQTTGTCTWELKTVAGVSLGTGSLTHSTGGDYAGTVESTVTALLTEGTAYHLFITFVQGSNNDFRRLVREATYREEF